jgi:hypothetical protein
MAEITRSDLQELVDGPNETLDVEYKEWLDLGTAEVRVDLARHIAALSNHGGGALVFGFTDAMAFAGTNQFVAVDRDAIAGIVKRYLEPAFQCDVRVVRSAVGNEHSVVLVPAHGPFLFARKLVGR